MPTCACIYARTARALHFITPASHHPCIQGLPSLSKMLWSEKPARNRRKTNQMSEGVCSCHRRRGMKSKCLKLLGCFHGKELDLKSVLPALSVTEKRSLGKRVVALLMALVSQMLYWKGQASSSFRERKGVKINGAQCYLTLSLQQPYEVLVSLYR